MMDGRERLARIDTDLDDVDPEEEGGLDGLLPLGPDSSSDSPSSPGRGTNPGLALTLTE